MKRILFKFIPHGILIGLALAIYAQTFHYSFQYDDMFFIVENEAIRDLSDIFAIWNATSYPSRFISFYSFAINYHFHQLDVFGYHLTNFFIHLITSYCVWMLMFKVLQLRATQLSRNDQYLIAFLTALLFVVHPVQTEAITYITQRFASLASLFYLSSLCFYVYGRTQARPKQQFLLYIFSGIAAVLGMMTKEIVITLPLMILFIEFFIISSSKDQNNRSRLWSPQKIVSVLFILSFIMIIPMAFHNQTIGILTSPRVSESHYGDIYGLHTYVLTQFRVLATFLRLFFFPLNQNLSYDFEMSKSLFEIKTFSCFLLLAIIIFSAIKIRKKQPVIAFGILWFFITILANFVPRRHVIFEHKLYLSSIGLCLALCALLFYLLKNRKTYIACLSLIVLLFSFLAFKRNLVWQSELSLWEDTAKKSPNKPQVLNNLGKIYLDEERYEDAIVQFNKAIEIAPFYHSPRNNRGYAYKNQEKWDLALNDFNEVLKIDSYLPDIYVNRGEVLKQMGRYDLAMRDFMKAIKLSSDFVPAFISRGAFYGDKGKYELALADFQYAMELDPEDASVYNNICLVKKHQNKLTEALEFCNKAIQLNPKEAKNYFDRGNVYENMENYELALDNYKTSLELDPTQHEVYNNRGVLYGKSRAYQLAMNDLLKAVNIKPDYYDAYSNIGLVLKRRGELDLAITQFNKAISLNPDFASAYYNRGLTYQLKDIPDKALEDLEMAKKLGRNIQESVFDSLRYKINLAK